MNTASRQPVAPAENPHHRDDEVIARLKNSDLFHDYQEAFETAPGLPLVLRAAGAFDAPLAGSKNLASFCALMGGANKTCSACLLVQSQLESSGGPDRR